MGTTLDTRNARSSNRKGRPNYTPEYRRQVAVAACEPGISVAKLAQAHGLNPNMVFKWRRQLRAGLFEGVAPSTAVLLPVALPDAPTGETAEPASLALEPVEPQHGRPRAVAPRAALPDASMIAPPGGTRVWLAAGVTDMRRGMDGLAALVQSALGRDPFSGHIFLFRGRRGDLIKILWWSGDGMNLYAKRLERGRFVWPQADSGTVHLSAAQLSMLLEGVDWRHPERTWQPTHAA
ncbi:IS66 family insertion sequence element accessory protein TnpB [Paraburkholderia atlantica]|uniref:IS66 family insertion sequence element accessory protein TnpB n=1 Tax=Paraburkholderia atlantica TaxID=2654982 RepID=UPI0009FC0523